MAALDYLTTVPVSGQGKTLAFSRVVNPSEKKQADRINDRYFLVDRGVRYTQIKLQELCRILDNIRLPDQSQIMIFSDDKDITRLGKTFGVEEGDQEPIHNKGLWNRISEPLKRKRFKVCFQTHGLLSDSIHDRMVSMSEEIDKEGSLPHE